MATLRITRSSSLKEVFIDETENRKRKRTNIEKAPYLSYSGKWDYFTTFVDCAIVGETLLKQVNDSEELCVMGFDLEWPFNFQTGPGPVAVIQISPNLNKCYILHVSKLKSLPKTITELLVHPKIRLTGINIKNDLRKIARDFKGIDSDAAVANCIDLGPLANSVLDFTQRWSMQKLVEHFLELRINKNKLVRNSKWHIQPLSKAQQVYAAIDAYASLKLYLLIKDMQKEIEERENDLNIENEKNNLNI